MRLSFIAIFASSPFVLALIGCSSGTSAQSGTTSSAAASSADSASFCDSYCARLSTCDSQIDAQTCASKCENETSTTLKKRRSDVIADAQACFATSDCRQVLSGARLSECVTEAAVSLAPTQPTKDFCDGLVKAFEHCDVSFDRAECLSAMKTYSDPTLAEGQGCLPKSCAQLPDCISAAFGL